MCWSDRAFTLFEVLLAIVIVGCLAGAIAGMLVAALETEDIGRVESDLGAEFTVGFSRLIRDLRGAARLYECTPTSVGLTRWAGLMVGTPKGVFLFDWRNHRWLERNGGVIRTAIRSIFSEETGLILAGGADGCIYRTTDCGRSWQRIRVGSGAIVDIARAPDGTLFCLQESPPAVYRSRDDGATWVSCAPLPDAPPNAHALICRKDSVIVGTDWNRYGNIYYSDDGGASWRVASAVYVPPNTWMYCCPVDIQNNSSQNLTDYQVRIEVPFAQGKMRPDFGDIRFKRRLRPTDPDLPYWLEYYDSKRAIFWVKVPRLRARRRTRIWLFYGNPDLTSASSFTATMEAAYSVYKVSYNWVDRADNNAWLTGLFVYRNLTLPFRFPFYGAFYGDCHITTTGYIRFPAGNYAVDETPSVGELARRRMFAAYWGCFSGRHTYNGPGNRDIRYPGVYVYLYSDRVHIEWEVARVIRLFGRWIAIGGTIHQALLYRNGDIVFQMKFRYRAWGLAGISKGDGTTYINTTSLVGDGVSLLYAQRKFVEPEPSVSLGAERRIYNAARDVTCLAAPPDGSKLYAGTSPDGWVFVSTDGRIWTRTKGAFKEDATWGLAVESNGTICAGTASDAIIYRSFDGGASWEALQKIRGATNVPSFCRKRSGEWFAVANNGLLLYAPQLGWEMKDVSTVPPRFAYCVAPAFRRIRYSFNNKTVQRECNAQAEILARNIDSLNFTYYDRNMLLFAPASQSERDRVSVVGVSYSVKSKGRVLSRQSAVVLRGLP